MLPLTHNDYFTTSSTGTSWNVSIKKCTKRHIKSYHSELVNAARILYDNATSPITLLYSGGLDSEYMLNIFRTAGIPFNVAIISYRHWNEHDTKFAFDYCNSHQITPIVVDVDLEHFIKSEKIYNIADQVKCCAYQMPSIMYGLSKLDGTIIMANGEPYIKNFDGIWKYQETERVNAYMHWYLQNSIDGTPDFLRYTAESTLAFLKEPRVKELIKNKHPGKLSTRTSKHFIYSQNYMFVPRPKFTGWEEIEKTPLINEVSKNFYNLKKCHNGVFELEVNKLIKLLEV